MRMWGCPVYVLNGNLDWLEARSKISILYHFSKSTKEYQFYNPKRMLSKHAVFLDKDYKTTERCRDLML